eukprot:gnl/TRDRNA2_/TRDRNA2_33572_c0_seq1.p1 gnl/TRDRNA2_/TRDRNA2_33572_c0~~gnl/TRDRNA2_/TRDRNA2_33572_c0_seq1.p1  ORF type:complete len:243 (+),score=39.88 gnl/TRDRNA2_/TRDRNA2_33572_c0_seq1:3-731(+)
MPPSPLAPGTSPVTFMGRVTSDNVCVDRCQWEVFSNEEAAGKHTFVIRNTFVHVPDKPHEHEMPRRRSSSLPPNFRIELDGLGAGMDLSTRVKGIMELEHDVSDLPLDMPSRGSVGHEVGDCKPCFYMHAKVGCQFGRSCRFCHFFHPKTRTQKERPTKLKRRAIMELARQIFQTWQPSMIAAAKDSDDTAIADDMIQRCEQVQKLEGQTRKYVSTVLRALARGVPELAAAADAKTPIESIA